MRATAAFVARQPIRRAMLIAGTLLLAGLSHQAPAQTWPAKVVKIVVPFPAGSGGDIVARVYAPRMLDISGQQFIVENRAGAAGNIGAEAVLRAAPDGYSLLLAPASLASSQAMARAPACSLVRDFDAISILASLPFVLVINPELPAKSVRDLVGLLKARPGAYNYASSGVGGAGHLSTELFKSMAGVEAVHVPYKGGTDGIPDMARGQIAFMITAITTVLPHLKAARLRALAVTSLRRSSLLPDLPSLSEAGFSGYTAGTWHALLAPAGTSPAIIGQLSRMSLKIGQEPEVRARLQTQGAEPQPDSPEQVRAFIEGEILKWGRVAAAAGVQAE